VYIFSGNNGRIILAVIFHDFDKARLPNTNTVARLPNTDTEARLPNTDAGCYVAVSTSKMPPVKMSQKDNIDFLAPSFSMTYPA
jgi:hypothetical protein